MEYYLAYGSNLNMQQMFRRCPGAQPVGAAVIKDYELVFRRGYLTIEPKEGGEVPVGIWKITEEHEKALDRYEGFPKFYIKQYFDIGTAYVMTEGHPLQVPSDFYFYTVMQGYSDFGFDKAPLIAAYERVKWPEGE